MTEIRFIPVSQLLVDVENPRLDNPQPSQLESIRALVRGQKSKIINLARDILDNGLNPSDAMIVMPVNSDNQRYLVLEGNRRLCALKIMENPDMVLDLFSTATKKQTKEMSLAYQKSPVANITCAVVADRDEARHWIELRHGGEQEGAGIVRWGAAETARFRQRFGQKEIHLQILDFLEEKGALLPASRQSVPVTSMKRVVEDRHTRDQLGYDMENGQLVVSGDPQKMVDILTRVASDLSSGQVKTKDIYHKEDRVSYIDRILTEAELRKANTVTGASASSQPVVGTTTTDASATTSKQKRQAPLEKNRPMLIPQKVKLVIHQPRINEIYAELKKLLIQEYPNSVAVLFRVFIELSVDDYIGRNPADFKKKPEDTSYKLSQKLIDVADHLKANHILSEHQSRAVRHAAQADNFMAASVNTLNQYVHNPYFKPALDDLRSAWDNLQPFIMAMWI
ncbi:MAG: hypothetical protein AB1894_07395 [Chloroflexota bacterium]